MDKTVSVKKRGSYERTEKHKEQSRIKLKKWKDEGGVVWNKGTKGVMKPNKTSFKKGRKDDKHPEWKGDKASNVAMHAWVSRWRGKPDICEHCGKKGKAMQWANIDHKYRRVLEDYIRMCAKCHFKYDREVLGSSRGLKKR